MMFQTVRPAGLSPFSSRVFDVLEVHTTFPWAALKTQCGWRNIDPVNLTPESLEPIIPHLAGAIAKVTDRENGSKLMSALWAIIDEARSEAPTGVARLG